jgi:hypothetical protein
MDQRSSGFSRFSSIRMDLPYHPKRCIHLAIT